MACYGRTTGGRRCKNQARFFCRLHRWQPAAFVFSVLSVIAVFAGLFQDAVRPLYDFFAADASPAASSAVTPRLSIPIRIESTWGEPSQLDRKADFFIVQSRSQSSQEIVFSGSARVEIPPASMTISDDISVPSYGDLRTVVTLPASKQLSEMYASGGYEIQLVLLNHHGHTFRHMEQRLFEADVLKNDVTFWFRLDLEQVR